MQISGELQYNFFTHCGQVGNYEIMEFYYRKFQITMQTMNSMP